MFIGIAGTMLLNLMRVAAVAALAATWVQTPALLFHRYGATMLLVACWFAFWTFTLRWILNPAPSEDLEVAIT